MYCYVCIMHLKNGGQIDYSYKNGLSQTITGTLTGLTNAVVALVDTILNGGNTVIAYQDKQGNPMGIYQQVCIRGTGLCSYHVVGGQVS